MRAAVSSVAARAFNQQSQRVTRRSTPSRTLFHPVPSHNGQTSVDTFITTAPSPRFDSAPARGFCASSKASPPVYILWSNVPGCGGRRKTGAQHRCVTHDTSLTATFVSTEAHSPKIFRPSTLPGSYGIKFITRIGQTPRPARDLSRNAPRKRAGRTKHAPPTRFSQLTTRELGGK